MAVLPNNHAKPTTVDQKMNTKTSANQCGLCCLHTAETARFKWQTCVPVVDALKTISSHTIVTSCVFHVSMV